MVERSYDPWLDGPRREGYDMAQVCRQDGHVITGKAETAPAQRKAYCPQCGSATITECPACGTPIQGVYRHPNTWTAKMKQPPAHCHGCGEPYPWTVAAIQELADLLAIELDDEDEMELTTATEVVVSQKPGSEAAAAKLRKWVARVSKPAAQQAERILTNVTAEAICRAIFPHR